MKTYSGPPESSRLTSIPCNFCGKDNKDIFLECDGFEYVRCGNCALIYQNPRPENGIVWDRYDEEYFEYERRNEENFFSLMKMGLADIGFPVLEKEFAGKRWFLDVGCATGLLLSYVKERGWSEQGVEVCEPSVRYGSEVRGLAIHNGTLEDAGFMKDSFHVVHCSHLIEHVEDPHSFFREVYRVLHPGGYFIVTTPNCEGMQAKLKKAEWRSAIADHLYLFSRTTLNRYLLKNDFVPIRWKTWGGIPRGEAPAPVKRVVDSLAKLLGFGDVMICLARKKSS